jgi:hypothetical protein
MYNFTIFKLCSTTEQTPAIDILKLEIENPVSTRVARWYNFQPKIQIWVNFGGSCNGRCWYILWTFDVFYGRLVYFMDI